MNPADDSGVPDRISEADAARILERAIAIESDLSSRVSVEQLRATAIEAGISPDAFDAALKEFSAVVPVSPPRDLPQVHTRGNGLKAWLDAARSTFSPGRLTRALLLSGAFGALLAVSGGETWPIRVAIIAAWALSLRLAFVHRRTGTWREFLLDNIVSWAGFTITTAVVAGAIYDGHFVGDVLEFTLPGFVVTSAAGLAIVMLALRKDTAKPNTSGPGSGNSLVVPEQRREDDDDRTPNMVFALRQG